MRKTILLSWFLLLLAAGCGQEAGNTSGSVEESESEEATESESDETASSKDEKHHEEPDSAQDSLEDDPKMGKNEKESESRKKESKTEKNQEGTAMTDYKVLDRKEAAAYPEVKSYLSQLVQNTDLKGYRAFEVSDGWVLVVSTGMRPTGGYTLHVDDVTVTESGVSVHVREQKPAPDAMVTQALTNPAAAIHFHHAELPQSITVKDSLTGKAYSHWEKSTGTEEM
ncbi:hypothetical protein CR205_08675 [Alteribacter lacisalsi]|uniref:PrcB C-terminal domain-containing protein n=1 Tax=Alteribacter lacisalsi TaxID=2045244 RepID=A0A2W0HBS7_9BACI|nr:protease complex subunit PrcB family protein [Alteribacter lacisalsi]PYZ98637.1 hypothetical protein CR205_08675 [Alteribacter lacisalsi]